MPPVIFIFSLCAFAIGFTEFITIGLIPIIAADLHAELPAVGLTVTFYALGVVIGAPLLTALAARWSRKRLLLAAMVVFTLANAASALAGGLPALLAARFVGGLAHGVFFAVASSVGTRLVPPERAGTALALVFGGVTIAMSLGVPLGTWLGTLFSWQAIFGIITACAAVGLLGIGWWMPRGAGDLATQGAGWRQLGVLFRRPLLAGAAIPVLTYTGAFSLYTFLSPILLQVTGVDVAWVSTALLAYGVGSIIGTALGGRLTDRRGMDTASLVLIGGVTLVLVAMAFALHHPVVMIVLVVLLGMTSYGAIPPLQARILRIARQHVPEALDVASGMNIAAFNAGVVVGSALAGAVVHAAGLESLAAVGAAIAAVSVAALAWQIVRSRTGNAPPGSTAPAR